MFGLKYILVHCSLLYIYYGMSHAILSGSVLPIVPCAPISMLIQCLILVFSQNTKGMNSPIKPSLSSNLWRPIMLIFVFYKRHISQVSKLWVFRHPESDITITTPAILILPLEYLVRKSIPFRLMDFVMDQDGGYIVIHAQIECMDAVLVGLYLTFSAILKLPYKLIAIVAAYSTNCWKSIWFCLVGIALHNLG